jgi:hypothetical protein
VSGFLIRCKKARRLLWIVASPVVELGRARVAVPGGLLHVFELRAVFERRGDERRAHRMRRVTARLPDRRGIFPGDAVDRVRVHRAARVALLAVVMQRSKQWAVTVGRVPGGVQIGTQPRGGLWVDRQGIAPAALADDAERVKAPVLVQIPNRQAGDLGPPQTNLQTNGENGTVAQPFDRRLVRRVEHLARVGLRERQCRTFVTVDRRPLDLRHRIFCHVAMADQVLEQAGQRGETPADRRWRGALGLAHRAFPGDDGTVIDPPQLLSRGDAERRHEVAHVEPVGAAGAGTLLTAEPDFFFRDVGEARDQGGQGRRLGGGRDDRGLGGEGIGHGLAWARLRDKPDYHVEDQGQAETGDGERFPAG